MSDPLLTAMNLCGLRGDSWWPWRVLAKAARGLTLDTRERVLYEQCTQRMRVPTEPVSEVIVVKGRRSGGSRFLAAAADAAALQEYPQLAPGEMATVGIAAPDREQSRVTLGYAMAPFAEEPSLSGQVMPRSALSGLVDLVTRRTRWGIALKTNVVLEVNTCHYGRVRGRTFAFAGADELAFWADDTGSNPGSEVLAAIRPGLATLRGPLMAVSSPYARSGPLFDLHERYFGVDDDRVLCWKAPSLVMNPSLDPRVVQAAIERDPESAKSEFLAEFRTDAAALVTTEALARVTRDDEGWEPGPGGTLFVDVSSGSGSDSYACAVAHREGDTAVVDFVAAHDPPFNPEIVTSEIAGKLRPYGIHRAVGDAYAKGWSDAAFERVGLQYVPSPLTKSQLYLEMLMLVNSGRVSLPRDPTLIGQLASLVRKPAGSGRETVDHPQRVGAHDDLANAASGAAVLCLQHRSARVL